MFLLTVLVWCAALVINWWIGALLFSHGLPVLGWLWVLVCLSQIVSGLNKLADA